MADVMRACQSHTQMHMVPLKCSKLTDALSSALLLLWGKECIVSRDSPYHAVAQPGRITYHSITSRCVFAS